MSAPAKPARPDELTPLKVFEGLIILALLFSSAGLIAAILGFYAHLLVLAVITGWGWLS